MPRRTNDSIRVELKKFENARCAAMEKMTAGHKKRIEAIEEATCADIIKGREALCKKICGHRWTEWSRHDMYPKPGHYTAERSCETCGKEEVRSFKLKWDYCKLVGYHIFDVIDSSPCTKCTRYNRCMEDKHKWASSLPGCG